MVTFDNSVICEGNFFLSLSDSNITTVEIIFFTALSSIQNYERSVP
jgi:hypothetical protein